MIEYPMATVEQAMKSIETVASDYQAGKLNSDELVQAVNTIKQRISELRPTPEEVVKYLGQLGTITEDTAILPPIVSRSR